ncbi:GyrI-like domain-containing protein [Flavobacterium hibernum]|uniref:AraC family transcriptional regulator n=1 Tax=Flavobacterium hibernum TaxID=37752 RepID=A0A0D0EW27_9FLAO|nr:GyrI-like domain-containing protein [Flavobacterium hibernum]KIO51241.1 AraC family transcriptional regulator [Flavobacterium hibernum]OXA85147.1 AraC family transcriptional regulator [Flavobacterium hibernum]PTT13614.1 AraC family transcriptional regulator [Flavobacterium sp. HMWF030]STO19518.1 DNA gyrase inhibitor [Flavobacterium hibernum]
MEARIEILKEKKLIGKHIDMSFIENKTFQLWNGFMPRRKEINNTIDTNLYSLEVFPLNHFDNFDPNNNFQKWAAVEVSNFDDIPLDMETLKIPAGLYAVFIHKGPATEAHTTYHSIFVEWLPNSEYTVDERPHFAVMGDQYKKDDPNSQEEIWIPITSKV